MEKLRLIQCGVGGFGGKWVRNHSSRSEDFELSAIVDISPEALARAGDDVNVPPQRRFTSLEEALEKVQADAVLTVTPPVVHLEHAKLAFSRGLHLMTEKPIADTLEHAKAMVKLAEQADRQLLVSQNYRFDAAMQTLRSLMAKEVLGGFGHGHIDFYLPADFTGSFRERMEHVLLVDMAIHHLDLIRAVTGRNITRVYATTFKPAWSWYQHNAGLKMVMQLEGGLPFSYSGDWSGRGRRTDWSGNWRLQCAEGSLHYEHGKVLLARGERGFKAEVTEEEALIEPIPRTAQAATLRLFAEAIRSGKPAQISGRDNLWSFGAVMAGVISAEQGRVVDVGELISE